jgi:hypothetical protein
MIPSIDQDEEYRLLAHPEDESDQILLPSHHLIAMRQPPAQEAANHGSGWCGLGVTNEVRLSGHAEPAPDA